MYKKLNSLRRSTERYYFLLILLLLLITMLCSGCQSPQEKNGVSLLPQNRPSRGTSLTRPHSGMGMSF